MGTQAIQPSPRLLTAIVGVAVVLCGCTTPDKIHHDERGSSSLVVVGNERWSRSVIGGWFSFVYQPEGADIRIGVSRAADAALPRGSSDAGIRRRELALLRRHDDSTIAVQHEFKIAAEFGNVPCYQLQSSEPLSHLRALVVYQDAAGQIVNIGFYSPRSSVSPAIIRDYLNTMFRAKLIPSR